MVEFNLKTISRLQSLLMSFVLALVLMTAAVPGFSQLDQPLNSTEKPDWFGAELSNQWPVAFTESSFQGFNSEKKILFIYSKASSAYDQAFTTIAQSFQQHRIHASYLVMNYRQQEDIIDQMLQDSRFDLTIIAGSKATSTLYKNQPNPAMPVVTVTAKDPVLLGLIDSYEAPAVSSYTASDTGPYTSPERQPSGNLRQYAFTSLNIRPESLISYLQTLNPKLSSVGMIYSSNNQSALTTQVLPLIESARQAGITIQPLAIDASNPEASLKEQIPSALKDFRKSDPNLHNSLVWVTGSTLLFSYLELIDELSSPVPVVSAVPDLVSSKPESPMLSIGIGFQSNATLAAFYGRQILAGSVTPAQLPVGELSPPDIAINFRKVEESGWRIPVRMFELATILFNRNGQPVNRRGMQVETSQF